LQDQRRNEKEKLLEELSNVRLASQRAAHDSA
jgi:hypothetical protein